MAKGNNNTRSKKPHTSKPYDVSNSFVKKVTSGVSSLLPQSSWLSRWFASSSSNEEAPSAVNEDDNAEESGLQSPPCKRARIPLNRTFPENSFQVSSPIGETHPWPIESVASPIPNVFSDSAVPGPSRLARNPNNFQTPNPSTEDPERKYNGDKESDSSESTSGCSYLAPQRVTSSSSSTLHKTPVSQKLTNHSQFSLFPSATHKLSPAIHTPVNRRRPSFNVPSFASPNLDSSKLSRESSLNSPFYIGPTMYGGASAYRRPRDGISSESLLTSSRRGSVTVRPANEKSQSGTAAEATMSQTARRILEALEQFSSPVSEARRMPLPPQPPLSAKRKRPQDLSTPVKSSNPPAAALNPLTIPMPPERLRLHRLQDTTEAARRLAKSRTNFGDPYSLRSIDTSRGPGKVTKSKPLDEDEPVPPVNLPNISLPITTLPTFDLFSPLVQSTDSGCKLRTDLPCTTVKTTKSDQTSERAEVENSKKSSATFSIVASTSVTSSCVDSSVTSTSSVKKPPSIVLIKSSVEKTNFKFSADNTDILQRREDSLPNNLVPKQNSDKIPYNFSNSPNINNKVEKRSNSPIVSKSPSVASSQTKIPPPTKASSTCDLKPNEFVFSTPTVLPSTKFKEAPESKMKNFYFSKPSVLELPKYKSIREEPNGFHKNSLKNRDSSDVLLVPKSIFKEPSEKNDSKSDSESVAKSKQLEKSKQNEKNDWGAKFVMPESWECLSCLVRNKKDVDVCVCCGSKKPSASSVGSKKDPSGQSCSASSLPISGWDTKFHLQPGMWECSTCLVRNKETDSKCVSCTTPRSAEKTSRQVSQSGSWGSQFKLSVDMWECATCLVRNKEQDTKCVSCTTSRTEKTGDTKSGQGDSKKSEDWGQKFKKSGTWECPVCMIQNKDNIIKCAACEEPKPGHDKNIVGTSGSIKFNFEMPSNASSFKFGIDKADTGALEASSKTTFQFGCGKSETVSASQASFSFGTKETKTSSGFMFGIPQAVASSSSASVNITTAKSDASSVQSTDKVSTTSNPPLVSTKISVQSDSTKVGGLIFGISSTAGVDDAGDSSKLNVKKSGRNDGVSNEKELKFGVSQASPVGLSCENKNNIVVTTDMKSGQSSTSENKVPSFNFGTCTSTSKPATFSFTSNIASSSSTVPAPVTTSSLVLPATSTTTSTTTDNATTIPSTSSIFSFGNGSSTVSKPVASCTSSFSFKGSGIQPASSSIFSSAPQSQFKTPGEGLFANKTAASTTVPVFGSNSNSSPKTTSVQTFVTTATTTTCVPTFSTPSTSVFGSSNASSTTAFGANSTKPIFGNASATFSTVTTTVSAPVTVSSVTSTSGSASNFVAPNTCSFGVPATTAGLTVTSPPTFGTTTSSNFGVPTSTTIVSSNSTPSFGTPAPVAFGAPATSGNTFGGTNAASTFSTTSSIFGSSNTSTFGSSTTPAFGSTSVPPNFGGSFGNVSTTTAPAFVSGTPVVSTVGTTPNLTGFGGFSNAAKPTQGLFMFCSPTTTALGSNFSFSSAVQSGTTQPAVPSTPVFGFGSANATNVTSSTTTTPTAAAAAVAATPAQGFGVFSFPTAASTPAQSAPGIFGNNTASVPGFGSTTTSTSSAPAFGAGSAASPTVFRPAFNFGSGGSQLFSFGGSAQSGSNQPAGSAAFSFGQNQPQTQGHPQPSAQPQTPQFNPHVRPSFNFTGGETPQFTASGQSATPTPRRVKKAVRRTQRP